MAGDSCGNLTQLDAGGLRAAKKVSWSLWSIRENCQLGKQCNEDGAKDMSALHGSVIFYT